MSLLPIRNVNQRSVSGEFVQMDGECWYKIGDSHLMPDFFICPVSSSDHWMFISSRGALTAGRRNPDSALFPYYSADKIVDMADCSGAKTIIRARSWNGETENWEPFSGHLPRGGAISRQLYKNFLGNRLCLEESNDSLNLTFRYCWSFGNQYGFVRSCRLINRAGASHDVALLDGIQNVLPYGLDQNFQLRYSNLGDAYKKSELLDDSGLGLFYLSSIPTDRAEPSEGLRATVAWQRGLERAKVLLSSSQLDRFRGGFAVTNESDVRGRRGAYFVVTQLHLDPNGEAGWSIIANVNQDHTDVINLHRRIIDCPDLDGDLQQDVADNEERLLAIVSASDGRQMGADRLRVQRHQSNVLFNVMRGGLPCDGYQIDARDFRNHVHRFNVHTWRRNQPLLGTLDASVHRDDLRRRVRETCDPDLLRITLEYLPFTFSRRHGDPTRPWNSFSIDLRAPAGSENLSYQGNWRDIFQNWEALSLAYPEFVESMVFRFLNASTADGYNPYRVTKDGFEFETPEPDDQWTNIGYWGDHQIIYLLKLLEWSRSFDPSGLSAWLDTECCTYAQVPYRIRRYDQIRRNPRETIDFDDQLAAQIQQRVESLGADGKLLPGRHDDAPLHVTLAEKLLVPALAKLTNFVPGGGVWLNTQRPEWNDANNALVGNGLSVVTACYLRRFFAFMRDWFSSAELPASVLVSREVATLLSQVSSVLKEHCELFRGVLSDQDRKRITEAFSTAGSQYRERLYEEGLSGEKQQLLLAEIVRFFDDCLMMLDHTIRSNRREDGLYHSYNLLAFEDDAVRIQPLYEMLEGQVAALSSGLLSSSEAADLLDALRASKIYRNDQQSYMLYPDRVLPRFLEKNLLPRDAWLRSALLRQLIADGDSSIVREDVKGDVHFNGDFRSVKDLNLKLDLLGEDAQYADFVADERSLLNELYELTFNHRDFTGRSGTFFGYEGLGSIYWHMVSKLSLATIENYIRASELPEASRDRATLDRLRDHYREIRAGIGLTKSPAQYGGFPSDPYSHTPKHAGVQQPGMTGQVKEDILSRMAELGMRARGGILSFDPVLFESCEFLEVESQLDYFDLQGTHVQLPLSADCFAYTICQIPIIYHRAAERQLVVNGAGAEPVCREELSLTAAETASVFARRGEITRIDVYFESND